MNIAIIGFNSLTKTLYDIIEKKKIDDVVIKYILTKHQIDDITYKRLIISDYAKVLEDTTIDTIVELVDSYESYLYIKAALISKKNVVTLSSSIIATNYYELAKLALENNVCLLFDPVLDISIPIVHYLLNVTSLNKITRIDGVIDSKSNYILSLMNNKIEYDEALKLADEKYNYSSEKIINNLTILAMVGFNSKIDIRKIHYRGLEGIDLRLIEIFNILGYKLKLTSTTLLIDEELELIIEPVLYRINNPISTIDYDNNIIKIYVNEIGTQILSSKVSNISCVNSIIHNLNLIIKGYNNQFIPKNQYNCHGNEHVFSRYLIKGNDIDSNIIDKKIGDIYITKSISGSKINELKEKIAFYARIE